VVPTAIPTEIPILTPEPTEVPTELPTATPTPTATATPVPTEVVPLEPPTVENKEVGPFTRGSQVTVDVLVNAVDPDGDDAELRVTNVTGAATISGRNVVLTAPAETGTYTYTVTDEDDLTASGQITVFVTANEAPVLEPLTVTTAYETPITIDLAPQASDPDGDVLFFVCCDNERGGGPGDINASPGQLSLVFTPNDGFFGTAGFAYTVDDQFGHQISSTVSIIIEPPLNQPPTAVQDTAQVPQDDSVTVDLAALTNDPDGDTLTFSITNQTGITVSLNGAIATVSADRNATIGAGASFAYEVSDGELRATSTVDVTVTDRANVAPIAGDSTQTLAAGSSATVDLTALSNDPDVGDQITHVLVSGTTADVSATLSGSQLTISAPVTAEGATAQLVWSATDLRSESDTGTISVTVEGPSQPPPQANPDTATTQPGSAITIAVLDNDVEFLGGNLAVVEATAGDGTASPAADGQGVVFNPGEFIGQTTVTYRINDVAGRDASSTITIETVDRPSTPSPPGASATAGQATITWTAPSFNGSPAVGYILTHNGGGRVELGLVNNHVWTGLTNGQTYTFSVTAINEIGESDPSSPSLAVTPDLKPEPPSAPLVTFLDGALQVTWNAPTPNGGSPVLDYELSIEGSQSGVVTVGLGASHTWTGLTNGEQYQFRVRARNAAGLGNPSPASAPENPERPPAAPQIGTTVRGDTALQVNWTRPSNDGGGEIEEYRIVMDGNASLNNTVAGANTNTYNWSSLTNGTTRTFQVQARNRAGWGPLSASSIAVKPCGRPSSPGQPTFVRGDGEVQLTWAASDGNGCDLGRYFLSTASQATQFSSTNSHTFTGLTNGQGYRFQVWASNIVGESDSSPASFLVTPAGPAQCGGMSLTATANGVGQIALSWTNAIANGDGPVIYQRSIWGAAWQNMGTGNSWTLTGLSEAADTEISIRALNSVGASPTCSTVSEEVWERPWIPSLTIGGGDNSGLLFTSYQTWNTDGPGLTSSTLRLFGCNGSCNETHTLSTSSATATTVLTLDPNIVYTADVRVCNVVGCRTSQRSGNFNWNPPAGNLSIGIGTPSTGPCWSGTTQGCFNIQINLSGWTGSQIVRCFSTMNGAPEVEFRSFTASNGTHNECSYTMAGRWVRVTVGGAAGDPSSGQANVRCGQWPTTNANEPAWNC